MRAITTFGVSAALALGALTLPGWAGSARADDLAVFNTGVGDDGLTLAGNLLDPHYDVAVVPPGTSFTPGPATIVNPRSNYLTNAALGVAGSRWIGAGNSTFGSWPSGNTTFRTTFDLTGFDLATAQLAGRVAADNGVTDIVLNGVSLGGVPSNFTAFSEPFTIADGFVDGVNTLDFVVSNLGFDPMAFRAELSGTADPLPEPPTAFSVPVIVRSSFCRGGDHPINLRSRGRVCVAVLSTDEIDATEIDPESVTFGGANVATRCRGRMQVALYDVDDDGRSDLILQFFVRDLDVSVDDTEVELCGMTVDGLEVNGKADVTLTADEYDWRGHWGRRGRHHD